MIGIIDYNAGNIRSVKMALDFLQIPHVVAKTPAELRDAEKLILPGVGDAAYAMGELQKTGFDSFIKEESMRGTPLLGICLGSQIIFDYSEEGDTACLGLVSGTIRHFKTLFADAACNNDASNNGDASCNIDASRAGDLSYTQNASKAGDLSCTQNASSGADASLTQNATCDAPHASCVTDNASSGAPHASRHTNASSDAPHASRHTNASDAAAHGDSVSALKIPHMGWNNIHCTPSPLFNGIRADASFYFVHSYVICPDDWAVVRGYANYGIKVPAVIAHKNIVACQFHPEKSGNAGLTLLKNFCTANMTTRDGKTC